MEVEQFYTLYKPLLFSIAYRMIGSVSDAEDIVHDIFIDIQNVGPIKIVNIKAYLCKMVTNRSIDLLKSAQKKREVYTGPWLPEPLVMDNENDPMLNVLHHDRINYAILTLMEQLNPIERIIFILKEAFDFKYNELSSLIGKEEANCRKILSRAKKKLNLKDNLHSPQSEQSEKLNQLVHQFIFASETGNIDLLLQLLSEDAVLFSDGGGKVKAAVVPIVSSNRVAHFIVGLVKKFLDQKTNSVKIMNINGQTGIIIEDNMKPDSVICFDFSSTDHIQKIFIIRNPDKLKHLRV
jgi:RNA polymerase sigma-70 factor (ECF subfamily)